jgi:two-component sensor histidine kinase
MDVGLFPSRKAAFEQARDEQRVIATAPVGLLAPSDTPGYVLFSPVYDDRGFIGCIMFVFHVDQLLKGFIHDRTIPMSLRVYDATDSGQMTYLAGVSPPGDIATVSSSIGSDDAEAVRQLLSFAGRKMMVLFEPGPDLPHAGMQQALMIGCLGLALTGAVLLGMNYFMRSSTRLAREIAMANSAKVSLELVNRELGHRVGNLLAVAQALVWLTYEASLSAAELRDAIIDRLHALHQSVGLINREDWKGVWLRELLKVEFAPIADRISLSGQDVLLKARAAQSFSLLFYELMTNSSKYGALSAQQGTVTAEWQLKDSASGPLFCFRWQEHGHGIIEPPTRQGFGMKLLTRLVPSDLSGQASLNFDPNGFRYELEASVERVVERQGNAATNVQATATGI